MVTCSRLPPPQNGSVGWNSTDFNSIASYSCNVGFVLNGLSERVCQASGYWSDRPPLCSKLPDSFTHPRPSPTLTPMIIPYSNSTIYLTINSIPTMSSAPRAHDTRPKFNIYVPIACGVIVLMVAFIVVIVVLILLVFVRRRKMNALAAAAANSVENPLYSGGQLGRDV